MFKKFVAGLALVAMLALPLGCGNKTKFVDTTDKIGRALATVNAVYFVVESKLEEALQQELPDAIELQAYLNTLKLIRDTMAQYMTDEDAEKAQAAAGMSLQILQQSEEVKL